MRPTFFLPVVFLSLLAAGCAAPLGSAPPAAAEPPPALRAASKAAFSQAMGAALNGDMRNALRLFDTVDPAGLTAKEQAAMKSARSNFSSPGPKPGRADLDPWVAQVLDRYERYWVRAMTGQATPEAAERDLADGLALLVGVPPGGAQAMATIEPRVQQEIRARGYHSLHGVTPPYREFMLWRSQREESHQVRLPEGGTESVAVTMLDGFVVLGWLGHATGNHYHSGGWATRERLFCVSQAYELDSETFRVSYLGHEAQHFADYRRFPALESPELEYRAKLVEIAQAEATLTTLLEVFTRHGAEGRDNPHAHANRRVVRELGRVLGIASVEGPWWEAVPPARIRAAALRLLQDDSQSRSPARG